MSKRWAEQDSKREKRISFQNQDFEKKRRKKSFPSPPFANGHWRHCAPIKKTSVCLRDLKLRSSYAVPYKKWHFLLYDLLSIVCTGQQCTRASTRMMHVGCKKQAIITSLSCTSSVHYYVCGSYAYIYLVHLLFVSLDSILTCKVIPPPDSVCMRWNLTYIHMYYMQVHIHIHLDVCVLSTHVLHIIIFFVCSCSMWTKCNVRVCDQCTVQ